MKKQVKTLNDLSNNLRNRFALISVDETTNWREDIQQKARRIDGVYLVNLKEPTHLCELSVSYYAVWISNFFHNIDAWKDENGDISDELTNGGEYGSYFSGNSVFEVKKLYNYDISEEDAIEYEMCNPTV